MGTNPATAMTPSPGTNPKIITVTPNNTPGEAPTVDKDPCYLTEGDKQGIQWKCTRPGAHFKVIFKNQSPFAGNTFTCADPDSGPPKVKGGPTKYKYDVSVDGGKSLDPNIIINPGGGG